MKFDSRHIMKGSTSVNTSSRNIIIAALRSSPVSPGVSVVSYILLTPAKIIDAFGI